MGQVNQDAFFTLLSLNNITLSEAAKSAIVKQCSCASREGPTSNNSGLREIKYPTAIMMMCIDMSAEDPFSSPWIARTGERSTEESNIDNKSGEPTPSSQFQVVEESSKSQKLTHENIKQISETPKTPVLKEVSSRSNQGSKLGSYVKASQPTVASSRTPTKVKYVYESTASECSQCHAHSSQTGSMKIAAGGVKDDTWSSISVKEATNQAVQNQTSKQNKSVVDYAKIRQQKQNDQDCMSELSKAIQSVRETKGQALSQTPKPVKTPSVKSSTLHSTIQRRKDPFMDDAKINYKEHDLIKDFYQTVTNVPYEKGVFGNMNHQDMSPLKGKKPFEHLVNKSNVRHMYPTVKQNEIRDLFIKRQQEDFCNKHGVEYVPPPVVKDFETRTSFVHNCIANKTKTNFNHFSKIYNSKVFNENKYKIICKLHNCPSLDFRVMTQLKNALFDSDNLVDNHLIPVEDWDEQVEYLCQDKMKKIEPLILKEIMTGEGLINLQTFTDLIDLFTYLPIQKKQYSNDSANLFMVMSSNTQQKHTHKPTQGGYIKRMLDLLWIKIQEKYESLPEAYRYFDQNFNNRVGFNEFQKGLNAMRITYQVNQVNEMFQYLDRGNKGYISYLDFCEMAEERRRNLDQFDYTVQDKKNEEAQKNKNWLHTYLDDT